MKKNKFLITIGIIGFCIINSKANQVSHTDYISGNTITASGQNANENAIISAINGNLDTTNLKSNAAITGSQLANNTVTSTQIANQTITSTQIANQTITGTQIAAATITGDLIASSVTLAGSPFTTTQPINASSTTIATTAFVNPVSSITASGYMEFADGIYIEWGSIPLTNGNGGTVTITFPLTFPNHVWGIQTQSADISSGNGHDSFHLAALSTSQFTLHNNDATTAFTGYWFALGN